MSATKNLTHLISNCVGRTFMMIALAFVLPLLGLSTAQEARSIVKSHSVRAANRFPDAGEAPVPGWSGPVFHLSQDYPRSRPLPEKMPWKKYRFDDPNEWKQYLDAVLTYCLDGNREVDWDVQRNPVRKWYHAPWMHWGTNGREFIHGLTHERVSLPGELAPTQKSTFQNWAVGFYNQPGGWILGKVWADPNNPNPEAFHDFPDGTVSIKLLFSLADPSEVPYIAGSKEWDAYIYTKTETPTNPNGARTVQKMRLLQVDIAVRDTRNDANTGWVFATYTVNGALAGADPYKKLIPVGIMWGNDPQLSSKGALAQTLINESADLPAQHLGWNGRLNGPVDNPLSSCLSCHSTSQWKALAGLTPPRTSVQGSAEWMEWFRNIRAGTSFSQNAKSLDYSLQLGVGMQNFYAWKAIVESRGGVNNSTPSRINTLGLVGGVALKKQEARQSVYTFTRAPEQEPEPSPPQEQHK
jgi:hypothetical protein